MSAVELMRAYLLGDYTGKFPSVDFNTDGNVFNLIGKVKRAWQFTDREVSARIGSLFSFAMAGRFPEPKTALQVAVEEKMEADGCGYDEMLSVLTSVCRVEYSETEDEDEDEDC